MFAVMYVLLFVEIYLAIGLLFALWFLAKAVGGCDESAKGVSWLVKLLWLPGVLALWPLLWRRVFKPAKLGGPNHAPARHRAIWLALAVVFPTLYLLAIAVLPARKLAKPIGKTLAPALPDIRQSMESEQFLVNLRRDASGASQVEIFVKSPLAAPTATIELNGSPLGSISTRGIYRFPTQDSTLREIIVFDPVKRVDIAKLSSK